MSQENVDNARRAYATLNEAYRAGDPNLLPLLQEQWDPDAVFEPAGALPDSKPRPHHGWDGVLQFIGNQMEASSEGWLEAEEFIDRGDYLRFPTDLADAPGTLDWTLSSPSCTWLPCVTGR